MTAARTITAALDRHPRLAGITLIGVPVAAYAAVMILWGSEIWEAVHGGTVTLITGLRGLIW